MLVGRDFAESSPVETVGVYKRVNGACLRHAVVGCRLSVFGFRFGCRGFLFQKKTGKEASPIALGKLSASQEKAAANCGNPNQDPRRDLPEPQTAKEQQCEGKALRGINRTGPYRLIKGSQKYAHYCCVRSGQSCLSTRRVA